jgi:crotonobetainyl-CoA:carnitine CoA-transferase CaiB-like acyl-CoA transferase
VRSGRLPLEGVRVADFSMTAPAPDCAAILASLGAEVIRVGPLAGAPAPSGNGSQRSIRIDLGRDESREVVARLARQSDVALEDCGAEAAERLGIDCDTLRQSNPRLIHCSIAGDGRSVAAAVLAALYEREKTGRPAQCDLAQFEAAGRGRRLAPAPGEHTREILVELRFDDAEIADMKKAGAIP